MGVVAVVFLGAGCEVGDFAFEDSSVVECFVTFFWDAVCVQHDEGVT